MKYSISKSVFFDALQKAGSLPVSVKDFQCVLFRNNKIYNTNYDSVIAVDLKDLTGDIPDHLIPQRNVIQYLKSLPDGEISVEVLENKVIIRGADGGKFVASIPSTESFNIPDPKEYDQSVSVEGWKLKDALSTALAFTGEEGRYALSCVFFRADENLSVYSSDGRFAFRSIIARDLMFTEGEDPYIGSVHSMHAKTMCRLISPDLTYTMKLGKTSVQITGDNLEYSFMLFNANPPGALYGMFDRVQAEYSFNVSPTTLIESLNRVYSVGGVKEQGVIAELDKGCDLQLSKSEGVELTSDTKCPVDYSGDEKLRWCFNWQAIMPALNLFKNASEITVKVDNDQRSHMIIPCGEHTFFGCKMQLR